MTPLCCEGEVKQGLHRLFAAANDEASRAMCRWTNSAIRLTLDEACELPLEDACGAICDGDEQLAMVAHTLEDEIGGTIVLMFDEENGRRLAALLLGKDGENACGWSEMDVSALTETGNILSCAYVGAIARLIDRRMVPSVPYFVRDYGASVLQQALTAQAAAADSVLVCRTVFHQAGRELNWLLLFVPTVALRTAIENGLKQEQFAAFVGQPPSAVLGDSAQPRAAVPHVILDNRLCQ